MSKRVHLFTEGGKEDLDKLGGKGANLCEMTSLGLPVPFGFIITTPTCHEFFELGKKLPADLHGEYKAALQVVEAKMGCEFGNPLNPLLLSVRSGAPVSMPGMMDTILNLGMNDEVAERLSKKTNNSRFAYDSYRRFIQMYSNVVLGENNEKFEDLLINYKSNKGYSGDLEMSGEDWSYIVQLYKKVTSIPEDPFEQLEQAIQAVFLSWNTPRAIVYREMNHIPDKLGTAVTIQSMVFGNFGETSGSGVAFTRNPATGEKVFFGEILMNAAGEDVVAGTRTPEPLTSLNDTLPAVYAELNQVQNQLEKHYRDMQDLEFTIQEGKLYMLQTRGGKRTGQAAIKIAVDMVEEGLIDKETALLRITAEHINSFLHPMIDPKARKTVLATGLPASPGGVSGKIVFSANEAVELTELGETVILVRRETTPEDIHGMRVAAGILTELGGMTSHAAVVARGMGVCAITGCHNISVNYKEKYLKIQDGRIINHLEVITLDGSSGEVILGDIPKVESSTSDDFQMILEWADQFRTLKVRANAETTDDTIRAKVFGAEGIGLCRTEHMFFDADRIDVMRAMILANDAEDRKGYLEKLYEFQKKDMAELFRIMEGMPVTIRLLDPPLHEFLPRTEEELKALSLRINMDYEQVTQNALLLHEVNPMMGFRGCRLSLVNPEITRMQIQAIINAALEVQDEGIPVFPEIMIPLVVEVEEIK